MANVLIPLIIRIARMAKQRNHAALPVIGLNDVGPPVNEIDHVQNRTLEERKPLPVIVIAIEAVTLKVALMLNEVVNNAIDRRRIVGRRLIDPARMYLNRTQTRQLIIVLLNDTLIQRQNDTHIVAPFCQSFRKGADDVRKAAGFAEGKPLRSRK